MDIYVAKGNYGPLKLAFDYAAELSNYNKPIALTENGPIPDPVSLLASNTPWLWFMPWWGGIAMDGEYTSQAHLAKVYDHPFTVTLDQVTLWR